MIEEILITNEPERLAAVDSYQLIGTPAEADYDDNAVSSKRSSQ